MVPRELPDDFSSKTISLSNFQSGEMQPFYETSYPISPSHAVVLVSVGVIVAVGEVNKQYINPALVATYTTLS